MKKLFRMLMGRSSQEPARQRPAQVQQTDFQHSQVAAKGAGNHVTIQDDSENGIRRQLVQVLLRDALRRHGIPASWIELQMLVVASSSKGAGMYVRLVLKHWDERLMCYLVPFQNKVLADITRFEPKASEWLHGISWQLELNDLCPYKTMPEKDFWTTDSASTRSLGPIAAIPAVASAAELAAKANADKAKAEKEVDVMADIERLFAIRDQELGLDALSDAPATDFQQTETYAPSGRPPLF